MNKISRLNIGIIKNVSYKPVRKRLRYKINVRDNPKRKGRIYYDKRKRY